MSQALTSRLVRAVRGQSPQHPAARRITAQATARDVHPTRGSAAVMQAAAGGAKAQVLSLNVRRADGSQGPAFCWGVPHFGWGQGEWPTLSPAIIFFDPSALPGDDPVGPA